MKMKALSCQLLSLGLLLTTAANVSHAADLRLADLYAPIENYDAWLRPLASCNPPLNSVRSAHGNADDWHIDTAHEFLFGEDMGGVASAANHAPAAWSRQHLHVGMTHTDDYYNDDGVIVGGLDHDISHGIDRSMLFFYAGHGSPTSWSTLGSHGSQSDMLLGNCGSSSSSRYYWQCSCKVFAHGPHDCGAGVMDYGCPQDFDGSADSAAMRNVYERWGPALDASLRMACGASTSAYCHEDQTNRIWDNYNNRGFDVADSFIFGLHSAGGYDSGVVPMCITTGGWFASSTPLFDVSFTNLPNPSGSYFHIQYLSHFDATAPEFRVVIPRYVRLIDLRIPDPPPFIRNFKLVEDGDFLVSTEQTEQGRPVVRLSTQSHALYLQANSSYQEGAQPLSREDYIERALSVLKDTGLHEEDMGQAEVSRLMIDTVPRAGHFGERKSTQKSVLVSFPRIIEADGVAFKVLGAGGKIQVQLANDGSPMNASKVWRTAELDGKARLFRVKDKDAAYKEALEQLGHAEDYRLASMDFGYKALSGSVKQETMQAVYQFVFQPREAEQEAALPPRMIEIPAI